MFQQPKTVASGSPFQHLASRLNLTTAKKAEDDEDKKKDAKAEDDKDEKDEKKSKKAKNEDDERGDDDEKNARAEEKEEPDDGEKDEKKSKKSKSKKAEDDEDKKDARAEERKRISDILLSQEANVSNASFIAALGMALETDMSPGAVRAIVRGQNFAVAESQKSAPAPKDNSRREALEQRMSKSPKPDIGADGDGGTEPTFAQKVILAGKRRRGEI